MKKIYRVLAMLMAATAKCPGGTTGWLRKGLGR